MMMIDKNKRAKRGSVHSENIFFFAFFPMHVDETRF